MAGSIGYLLARFSSTCILYLFIATVQSALFVQSAVRRFSRRNLSLNDYRNHIERKMPTVRYDSGATKICSEECAVCLSRFEDGDEMRKLRCEHWFHKACLDTWLLKEASTCPLCRMEVVSRDVVSRYRRGKLPLQTSMLMDDDEDEDEMRLIRAIAPV
uniref:RING-type domain-containing protein n=1 Tax=Kalanchoe fedtschenkoi TaxID=63787 RepID=A0A7N0SV68_KALFE